MSLYRQAGGSGGRIAVVAAIAALIGLGGGYAIGRTTAPDPTLEELIAEARADAEPALSSLELVVIEYGQGDIAPSERQAAADHAAAAADAIEAADALEDVDPQGLQAARDRLTELQTAIEGDASPAEIDDLVARTRAAVEEVTRP